MSMVCVYALGGNTGTSQHCCLLCVIHNSVGSALLVPTVMGIPEPRSVERVTVQFLRFLICYILPVRGLPAIYDYAMNRHKCWVDWMKAIGMLFIIWGHAFPKAFSPFIYSFNVPLFFIISGYLFKRSDTFAVFLKKNYVSLIIPYLLLCLMKDFSHVVEYYNDIPELLKFPAGVLCGFHTFMDAPAAKNLWFIYTLFIIKVLFQIAKSKKLLMSLTVLCIVASLICGYHNYHPAWGVTNVFLAFPYFFLGYVISTNFEEKLSIWIKRIRQYKFRAFLCIIALLVVQFVLSNFSGSVRMFKGMYGDSILLFFVLGVLGTIICFLISVLLDNVRFEAIGIISVGTMVILQFHRDLYHPLGKIVKSIATDGTLEGVLSFLASFLVLLAFVPIIMLLQRYFPLLIGNRKCS